MGISKRHIDTSDREYRVDFDALADALVSGVPQMVFACVLGSAADSGVVKPYSDLDLAVYLEGEASMDVYIDIQDICREVVGPVRCDLGSLNRAEPVYRFEALKGRLLFTRDEELWLSFYSLTCREYETQMVHYEKQHKYRLEATGEI